MSETIQGSFPLSAGTNINSRYMFTWMSKYVIGTEAENSVYAVFFFICFSLFHFLSIFSGFLLSPFLVPWIKILYFNCKTNGGEFSQKVLSSHCPPMERVSEREKETEREKMLQHFKQVSATSDQTSSPNQQKYHSSNGSIPFKPIFPSIIRINCHQTVISQKAGKEWSL